MTDTTPRAGAPLLAANQAQKNVTHNEALYQFDALLCARFLDRDLTAPPASPADGDTYLVKPTATGVWTGQDGKIAYCADGGWRFYAPFAGLVVYVADETALIVYNGSAWVDYGSIVALENVPMLGINTTPDSTNKLSVQTNAALFNAQATTSGGSGDIRAVLSKQAASNTASFLFQDNFSGRAEIGLTGDDDFHVKVSPDGSSWSEGLKVANASGHVLIGGTADNGALSVTGNGYVSGKLGVGMAPTHTFGINSGATAEQADFIGTGAGGFFHRYTYNTSSDVAYVGTANQAVNGALSAADFGIGAVGNLYLGSGSGKITSLWSGGAECARADASANFSVGTTASGAGAGFAPRFTVDGTGSTVGAMIKGPNASTNEALSLWNANTSGNNCFTFFYTEAAITARGSITYNRGSSVVAYNTTSDARLKNVLDDQPDYRAAIESLWVGDFEWKASGTKGFGVVAQQAYEVMPYGIGVAKPENEDDQWHASSEPFGHLALWGVKDLYRIVEAHQQTIARLEAQNITLQSAIALLQNKNNAAGV